MNLAQVKCLFVLSIFAVIGFGPVSLTCLIGFYIVAMRPLWFFNLVSDLYDMPQTTLFAEKAKQAIGVRIMSFLILLVLFIIDIAPIPVTALFAFPIVLGRPIWFQRAVISVYGKN